MVGIARQTTPGGARPPCSAFLFAARRPALVYRIAKSFEQSFEPGHSLLHSSQPYAQVANVHAKIAHGRPDTVRSGKGEDTEGRSDPEYRDELCGKRPSRAGCPGDRAGRL